MGMYHCCNSRATVVALFLAFSLSVQHVQGKWVNGYDQAFTFTCGPREFIRGIVSKHHNGAEDRSFYLTCGKLPCNVPSKTPSCSWSGYTNGFDEGQTYRCPGKGYVAGLSSYHNNGAEDRRFKFYCCQVPNIKLSGCENTEYVNGFDQIAAYVVPDGKILKGMSSYHDNGPEDRQFKYEVCDISKK